MEWVSLLSLVKDFGVGVVVILCLIYALVWLWRKLMASQKALDNTQLATLSGEIKLVHAKLDTVAAEAQASHKDLKAHIMQVERDYMPRREWERAEDRINSQLTDIGHKLDRILESKLG